MPRNAADNADRVLSVPDLIKAVINDWYMLRCRNRTRVNFEVLLLGARGVPR